MSHFAQINYAGVVQQVIVADAEFIASGAAGSSLSWVETSIDGDFRGRFAGVGFRYDGERDAFIAPRPGPGWMLDEHTLDWVQPTYRSTVVQRLSPEEAGVLETLLNAEEAKLRQMFYAVEYFLPADPLFAYLHFVLATAFSVDGGITLNTQKADELLAPG